MEKILIVVDMQNDFISGSLGTPEALEIVPNVVKKIRRFKGRIYATQDTHTADYLFTQEGKKLPIEHCINLTNGWLLNEKIINSLYSKRKVTNVEFITKDTFGSYDLLIKIMEDVIDISVCEIELIGLCTDICIISNAIMLKSFFPETKIVVDASCCAGTSPESHKRALEAMEMCQIDVIRKGELND